MYRPVTLLIFTHSFNQSLKEFNLPLICAFTWITPPGPYRATTCRERELTLDHIHTFLPEKDMESLPGWGIISMPGPPPRQHEHERRFTHSLTLTRWLWKDYNDGQMIFGDLSGPKASWHLSYSWGKAPKKPHLRNLSRPGIEAGPAERQARMLPPAPQRCTTLTKWKII